jgi:hypothetical protein
MRDILGALCWFFTGHRYGVWQDFREPPFEDGLTFELRRCRWCGWGEMRAKPYDMRRLERAALLDGIDLESVR